MVTGQMQTSSDQAGRAPVKIKMFSSFERLTRTEFAMMKKGAITALLTLSFVLSSSLSGSFVGSNTAHAQGAVRSVHGEWEIRCDTPPGARSEQCALMQYVTAADRDNVGLTVIVLKTADKTARILRVLSPLGVLLPHGLGLRVDDTDVGRAGFIRCLPQGCIAEIVMDDKLIKLLSDGKFATFIVFQTPEEGIGIPIPLDGFKAGFGQLK
ncbi:Invasion protein IalB, involved in pathogenesis [Cohaesibacter gelatinilyticus]|uniref:Invasion protein IalB, involved in pathogenesis n=2 Tax=Cohaesibacter gelatinilyticus TaxID=372072 RepID=A0A285N951_9HYPH|nr:Invasion protein IalB, involved in pathogenesis [Cohaesibacter gelatinilyticus]